MGDCECLAECPFFNDKMPDNSGLEQIFKNKYCLGDNSNCARHMVFKSLGRPAVPPSLYPNMIEEANIIIYGRDL